MTGGVTVRNATEADAEALAAMRLSLQEHLRRANSEVWEFSDDQKRSQAETYRYFLSDPDKRIVVACRADGDIVGMAMGVIRRHEEFVPGRSGRLDDVWVSPEGRNSGVCARLIGGLLSFFQDAGVDRVTLEYVVGNAEAEAVWPRMGFKPVIVQAAAMLDQMKDRLDSG